MVGFAGCDESVPYTVVSAMIESKSPQCKGLIRHTLPPTSTTARLTLSTYNFQTCALLNDTSVLFVLSLAKTPILPDV